MKKIPDRIPAMPGRPGWSDNSGIKTAKTDDRVILVTYFPALEKIIYTLHAATTGNCRALLQIGKMKGYTVQTWIGLVSHDERNVGDCVYAGAVSLYKDMILQPDRGRH